MSDSGHRLDLWNTLKDTPKEARNQFTRQGGFSGTSINPTWLRRRLTEVFGVGGWTCVIIASGFQHDPATNNTVHYCNVRLRVKWNDEWIEHDGVGVTALVNHYKKGDAINDECCKMSYTDALGNAAQNLGIGADIRGFDRDKYDHDIDGNDPGTTLPGDDWERRAKRILIRRHDGDMDAAAAAWKAMTADQRLSLVGDTDQEHFDEAAYGRRNGSQS